MLTHHTNLVRAAVQSILMCQQVWTGDTGDSELGATDNSIVRPATNQQVCALFINFGCSFRACDLCLVYGLPHDQP